MTWALQTYVEQSSAAQTCEAQTSAQAISKELTFAWRGTTAPPDGLSISTTATAELWAQGLA